MANLKVHTGKRGQPRSLKSSGDMRMISEIPPAPDYFDEDATRAWENVCGILIDRGDLAEGDLAIVEAFAHNRAVFRDCNMTLAVEGLTVAKPSGIAAHPCVGIRKQAETQVAILAMQLGLTPRARRDLKLASAPKDHVDKTGGF